MKYKYLIILSYFWPYAENPTWKFGPKKISIMTIENLQKGHLISHLMATRLVDTS